MRSGSETQETFRNLEELLAFNETAAAERLKLETGIIGEPDMVNRFSSMTPFLSMPIDLIETLPHKSSECGLDR